MFARAIDRVRYHFDMQEENRRYHLRSGSGKLYLSSSSVLVSDGESFYDIPLDKVDDIERYDGDEPGIVFNLDGLKIFIRGESSVNLKALRHFLLPFIC